MKKIFILSLLAGISSLSFGQKIRVHESKENIGGGSHNALTVQVYGVDAKEVEKEWKSKMKDLGAKVSNNKGELFGDNAVIKEMGNNTVDMYARVDDKKDEVDLVVAFDLGGAYLNSSEHADKYKIAERIMHDFAVNITKGAIEYQLKTQQKALDKMNGQEKDLEKENKNLNNEVVDYQNRIKKDQDAIEKNKNDQAAKQKEISQQQQVVDETTKKDKAVE
jgi:hypothetical protein